MRWTWTTLAVAACSGTTSGTTDLAHSGTTARAPTLEEVRAAVDEANHCADATECVDLGAQCPFGCWILVNAAEADVIQAQMDAYFASVGSSCTYSCANRGEIVCDAGVCEAEGTY